VLGAVAHVVAHVLHPPREPVALMLQLLQAEQARARVKVPADDRRDVRKARRDHRRQLALEPGHLRPQRAARDALVHLRNDASATIDDQLLRLTHCRLLLVASEPTILPTPATAHADGRRAGSARPSAR
jgi:hypothetical protein